MEHALMEQILKIYPYRRIYYLCAQEIAVHRHYTCEYVNRYLVDVYQQLFVVHERIQELNQRILAGKERANALLSEHRQAAKQALEHSDILRRMLSRLVLGEKSEFRADFYAEALRYHTERLIDLQSREIADCKVFNQVSGADALQQAVYGYTALNIKRKEQASRDTAKSVLRLDTLEQLTEKITKTSQELKEKQREMNDEAETLARLRQNVQMMEYEIRIKAKYLEMMTTDADSEQAMMIFIKDYLTDVYQKSELIARINSCDALHYELAENHLIEVYIEKKLHQLLERKM